MRKVCLLIITIMFFVQVPVFAGYYNTKAGSPDISFYMAMAPSSMKQDSGDSVDVGTRFGMGGNFGIFLTDEIELEAGFTWNMVGGSYDNSAGFKWNVNSNPLYSNIVFHVPVEDGFDIYLGGGLNFSFWSLESDTGSYNAEVTPGMGTQFFGGMKFEFLYFEAGLMNTTGNVVDSTIEKIELNDTYFQFGVTIWDI